MSTYFAIGSSSYPIQKLYAKTIYLDGADISAIISKTPKFTSLQVGGSSYYWKIDENAMVPSSTSSLYFNIGSSGYPIQKLYAKEIYLDGTKLTAGGSSTSTDFKGKSVNLGGSSSYYIVANTNRELRPTNSSISSNYFYLGTASYPWHYAYIGSVATMIGTQSGSKLGFFGTTPAARQTVSSTATVATLITALKKYGLIA